MRLRPSQRSGDQPPPRGPRASRRIRALAIALSVTPMALIVAGILLAVGGSTGIGVALLAVGLLILATPFQLVLRAFGPPREPPAPLTESQRRRGQEEDDW